MDLKTSLPQKAPADIVYSLPANFTCKGDKMDGHFCVTKEKIYIYNGSEITLEYSIDDFSEFECKQQIGTSMAQGTLKSGETICFCGFSQDQFLRYAELMKLLDHCLRTGELGDNRHGRACLPQMRSAAGGRKGMYLLHWQGQDNGQAHKTHCAIQEIFCDRSYMHDTFRAYLGACAIS